jgi:heme-degrading monooxygenase HmoA
VPTVIEIMTFRLAADADASAFRDVDGRVQVEFAYQQPGFLRRTLARSGDRWLVLQIWRSVEAADAAQVAFEGAPLGQAFMALVDHDSLTVERYEGVD